MKIIGYSERGAMNALFYGMAMKEDIGALKKFLELAKIDSSVYKDFELYMECSLSDFGDPDLVIIAQKDDTEQDVFFIEAKVSHRVTFSLEKQRKSHDEYCGYEIKKNDKKYDASNLFFQLRLKELFFSTNEKFMITDGDTHDESIKCKKGKTGQENHRSIGSNEIVGKFARIIKENGKQIHSYYIAIIPECEECQEPRVEQIYDIDIRLVPWERILECDKFRKYLDETIRFNQVEKDQGNKGISQILNNPFPNNG